MQVTIDNLLSGIVGAVLGVISASLMSWFHSIGVAQDRLKRILLRVGNDIYWGEQRDGTKVSAVKRLNESHYDLMDAILELHRRMFIPWRKQKLLNLGYKLLGHSPATKERFLCGAVPEREEALETIKFLLKLVGYPYSEDK